MSSKNQEYKLTYEPEKKFDQLFTGHRIDIDASGRLIVSPCLNSIKFTEIKNGKQLHEIKLDSESTEESEEEYIVTFELKKNRLVVAYNSGLLRHWSVEITEQIEPETSTTNLQVESVLLRTWKSLHVGPVASIKIDSTNSFTATGGSDGSIKVWDIVNNYCTHNFKEAKGVINTVAFASSYSNEMYQLVASGDDYAIHVWNLITSKHLAQLDGHNGKVTDIIFTPDGEHIISSSRDKLVFVWNGLTFVKERTIAIFESVETIQLVSSENLSIIDDRTRGKTEKLLITAGESGLLKVWDYKSGKHLFTQNNSLLRVKDVKLEEQEDATKQPESEYTLINQLVYNQSLNQLIAVSFDKDIIFHNIADLSPTRQLIGQNDDILDIQLIGDEEAHIAVATNSPKIKVFELATSNCFLLLGHTDIVLCLAVFAHNPNLMISSSKDNSVRVWHFNDDITSAICLFHGTGHTHSVTSLATSMLPSSVNECLFFLSGSEDTTLKYWKIPEDIEDSMNLGSTIVAQYTQSCHEKAINSIDVSPNNKVIATGSQDKTAKLWMLPQLKLIGVIRGHRKGIWYVKFSPVDQVVATCSADSSIKIWSITDFSCLKTFQGHTSSVLKLSFIDQGMQFISSASDGNLKIWNLKSNECVSTFDAHDGKVWAMAISKDEERLVTGSDDSKIIVWRNITTTVKEKEAIKTEETIQREQSLLNYMEKRSWLKALKMALRMEHPLRTLNILKEILMEKGNINELIEQLCKLREDQLLTLLDYSVHWNTNSKHYIVAQCVVRAVLETIPPNELTNMPDFRTKVEKMLPYCQRHMLRVKRIQQYVTFADFLYQHMKLPDEEPNNHLN